MEAHSTLMVDVRWRPGAPSDPAVRRRVAEEIRHVSWALSQMEAMLFDAHQAVGIAHAYLLPRLELRLPLYDLGLRYKLVYTCHEKIVITLVDEKGKRVADVRLP